MSGLLEMFSYDFFVKGLAAAVLAGALCGLLSTFITLRGMSYIGHGLSHSIFGGFAASAVVGINVVLGAGIWGLGTAFAINWVALRYRQLLFLTFDPDVAAVSGVNTRRLDALLMAVLSLSILASLTVIGVTLVAAILVVPSVIARLLTNSFSRMLVIATGVGAFSGFVGMVASYQLDVPSGTTIVLTSAALFVIVLAVTGPGRLRRTAGMDDHTDAAAVAPAVGSRA